MSTLQDLIQQHVSFGKRTPKGWWPVKCAACNDYKERGAFIYDGDTIFYNCFNCGLATGFDPTVYKRPSAQFLRLLAEFGIGDDEIKQALGKAFIDSHNRPLTVRPTDKPIWSPPKPIEPPASAVSIMTDDSPWCEIARLYLSERALDPAVCRYMVSDDPKLVGRVIIPYYYRDRLIYWQGRALDDTITPRYYNPPASDKDKLIFNYDEVLNRGENLYVTEGALDALSIGPACALSDSNLCSWKLDELKKAASNGRRIIFVIDKNENGYNLGLEALKQGWAVAVMPDGIDDANKGRRQFGRLWLLNHLASTHVSGVAGEVLLRMKCVRNTKSWAYEAKRSLHRPK